MLVRLDREDRPIAETNRRLGTVADELGLPRPSYEQVRVLVHGLRAGKRHPGVGTLLLEVALRERAPQTLFESFDCPAHPK